MAGGALGGSGFLGATGLQPQPAGLPASRLLGHPGLCPTSTSHNLLATLGPWSLWSLGKLDQLDLSHNRLAELGRAELGPLPPTLALTGWETAAASWGCGPGHHARPGGPLSLGTSCSKLEAKVFAALQAWGRLSPGHQLWHLELKVMASIRTVGMRLLLANNPWVYN